MQKKGPNKCGEMVGTHSKVRDVLLAYYVLSRERVDVGEVDRPRRGEADVRHHVGGPDRRRRVGQEPGQGRRRRRLDVVELPEAVAAPVVVRQAPPVGMHVGLPAPLAEARPHVPHIQLEAPAPAVHSEELAGEGGAG
jgi:hypothetical protein